MLPRACLKCGVPGTSGICDRCKAAENARRGPRNQRGYDRQYDQHRRRLIEITWSQHLPCYWCSQPFREKSEITADHLIPLRDGGGSEFENLVPSCARCNYGHAGMRQRGKGTTTRAPGTETRESAGGRQDPWTPGDSQS